MTLRAELGRLAGGSATSLPGIAAPPASAARHPAGASLPATVTDAAGRAASDDERAFAQALAAGDARAFDRFVAAQATPVLRICYRILGRLDEAEDAAQEAFVLAYKARRTFRAEGSPDAWMARIATREAWRRRGRSKRREAATLPIDDAIGELLVDLSDPVAETLLAERGEAVRDAVAALPEPYREVVALRYFGDLSPAAIASVTQRPEGTVRAQLSRGLSRLRLRLGSYQP